MARDVDEDRRAANYAIDEAKGFLDRHPDAHASALGGLAALAFGLFRALYESPCHPGDSLVPVSASAKATYGLVGDWWVCPACGLSYRYRDATEV